MSELDEIVGEFLVESRENLDRLDRDLLALQEDPAPSETLARVFRTLHTLKGTCGMLGFQRLERLSHAGEGLLGSMRDGAVVAAPPVVRALLRTVDALRSMLAAIETGGDDGDRDEGDLIAELTRLAEPAAARPPDSGVPPLGQLLIDHGYATSDQVRHAAREQRAGDPRRLGEILVEQGVPPAAIKEALQAQGGPRDTLLAERVVRVDVGLLGHAADLVTRLSALTAAVAERAYHLDDPELCSKSADLRRIATELQRANAQMRLQPIDAIFGRLPRIVWDLSVRCGKRIRVDVQGAELELDRMVIDAVKDPVTHLVRNAVDHGVETPAARLALGKPAEGLLTLRASRHGNVVVIQVEDDGMGIAAERVRSKAVERGLISAAEAARLTVAQVLEMIFLPGVSTVQTVTAVSGRGVGLDVVKSNVDRIGGRVSVLAQAGRGTRFTIEVPAPAIHSGEALTAG